MTSAMSSFKVGDYVTYTQRGNDWGQDAEIAHPKSERGTYGITYKTPTGNTITTSAGEDELVQRGSDALATALGFKTEEAANKNDIRRSLSAASTDAEIRAMNILDDLEAQQHEDRTEAAAAGYPEPKSNPITAYAAEVFNQKHPHEKDPDLSRPFHVRNNATGPEIIGTFEAIADARTLIAIISDDHPEGGHLEDYEIISRDEEPTDATQYPGSNADYIQQMRHARFHLDLRGIDLLETCALFDGDTHYEMIQDLTEQLIEARLDLEIARKERAEARKGYARLVDEPVRKERNELYGEVDAAKTERDEARTERDELTAHINDMEETANQLLTQRDEARNECNRNAELVAAAKDEHRDLTAAARESLQFFEYGTEQHGHPQDSDIVEAFGRDWRNELGRKLRRALRPIDGS
jgi:hypothetical protein